MFAWDFTCAGENRDGLVQSGSVAGRTRVEVWLADLTDDHPLRMGAEEKTHDTQTGLRTHSLKHIGVARDQFWVILLGHAPLLSGLPLR